MQRKLSNKHALMLLLPILLLTGCASQSPSFPAPQADAVEVFPDLPDEAKQKIPAICLPSCSTNLSSEISSWQTQLKPQ